MDQQGEKTWDQFKTSLHNSEMQLKTKQNWQQKPASHLMGLVKPANLDTQEAKGRG